MTSPEREIVGDLLFGLGMEIVAAYGIGGMALLNAALLEYHLDELGEYDDTEALRRTIQALGRLWSDCEAGGLTVGRLQEVMAEDKRTYAPEMVRIITLAQTNYEQAHWALMKLYRSGLQTTEP